MAETEDVYFDAVLYISQEHPFAVLVYTAVVPESTFVQSSHQVSQDNHYWECKNRTLVFLNEFNFDDDEEYVPLGLSKNAVQMLVDNDFVSSIQFQSKADTYLNSVAPTDIYEVLTLDPSTDDFPSPSVQLDRFLLAAKSCSDFSIEKSGLAQKVVAIRKKFARFENAVPMWAAP